MDNKENVENVANEAGDELTDEQLEATSGGRARPDQVQREVRQVDTSPADNEFIRR